MLLLLVQLPLLLGCCRRRLHLVGSFAVALIAGAAAAAVAVAVAGAAAAAAPAAAF